MDNVIFAVGQKPSGTDKMNLDLTHGPYIAATNSHTSMEGVFASGDVVNGARTVVEAVAHSKIVAESMHQYMQSLKDGE